MCPVARAKGIIDKEIGKPGEIAGKTGIVCLFARVKPQVFQKDNIPVLHFGYGLHNPGPDHLPQGFDRSFQSSDRRRATGPSRR